MTTDAYKLRFDSQTGLYIIGQGSLGGKAKGLAFINGLLRSATHLNEDFPGIEISVPAALVLAGSVFEHFISHNDLKHLGRGNLADEAVAAEFLKGRMPDTIKASLTEFLANHHCPLAVRSSGMQEDARNHAYAGLYRTYMISNDQPDSQLRLTNLVQAIKLVFASTFYQGPKAYAKRAGHNFEIGRMAVIIQHAVGQTHGAYYYPAISGVAQSRDYYPPAGMKPDDGVATIALGLGKQVVSGERALRFCPKYPKRLLQRSSVEEVLDYAQRRFYALALNAKTLPDATGTDHVIRRFVADAASEAPIQKLAGTYVLAEHRIKDTTLIEGPRVLTFAGVLKYDLFPLPGILTRLLSAGESAMDVPIEMEFAVDLPSMNGETPPRFHLLQMRPMTASKANAKVTIQTEEKEQALCYTRHAMGNEPQQLISEIIYIKPDVFDPGQTRVMAQQVSVLNAQFEGSQNHYLLVGPGRWGTADPWLGIPVRWADISNVAAIVETVSEKLNAEPSIGAHFSHNLVSLGISYLNIVRRAPDHFEWSWLTHQKVLNETEYVAHVRLPEPVVLKVDGRTSSGVIFAPVNLLSREG